MFTTAMVKIPCKNLVNGISNASLGKPDYSLALDQHTRYREALETCGLKVVVLAADEAFPDSTFIEDTCLVTPHCAIITNPGADTRKGEISSVKEAIKTLGLTLEAIQAPGTLDAGDIMMVGSHFLVGLSLRTNKKGFEQLSNKKKKYGMTAAAVPLTTVLHLKTGISYLENNTFLAFGEFLNKPEFQNFNLLPVDEREAYAANCVWINDRVLVPMGFPKTKHLIEENGYTTIEVDTSEFRKLDGGLSCLSLRF